jgi:hypothetical protein
MEKSKGSRKHLKWKIIIIIIGVLIVARLILPYIVLHYSNKMLANMNGYFGHIEDIDISLYRGAYILKNFFIDKVDSSSHQRTPFMASESIDLSVEWKSLFRKRLVGEIEFFNSTMRFTKDKVEPAQVQKDTNDFRKVLKSFMPLKINRFEIHNGNIQYIDHSSKPEVNLSMTNAHVLATNLSNVEKKGLLPATVAADADLYKGKLAFNMKLDPLEKEPLFDMNVELKNTYLPELNDFFKAYAKIDVSKGTFGLYCELAAKNGKFIGYVKPIIKDLDVVGPEDYDDKFLNKVWERVVGAAGVILKNREEKQVATKIPIEGEFKNANIDTWYAIIDLLRNAFIQAISPTLDNQISITSVNEVSSKKEKKGFFKKIFSKSEDKKDRKTNRRDKE